MSALLIRSNYLAYDSRARNAKQLLDRKLNRVFALEWQRNPKSEDKFGPNVFLCETPFGRGLGNLWPQLRWQLFQLRKILSQRPDLVYACDLDSGLIPLILKPLLGFGLIFDEFDPYTSRNLGFLEKFLPYLKKKLIQNSDIVVYPEHSRSAEICRKSLVITNLYQRDNKINHLTSESKVAVYLGVLIPDRMLLEVVEVFREIEGWKLIVGGTGNLLSTIPLPDSVNYIGPFDKTMFEQVMSKADLVIAFYNPSHPNHKNTASNKFSEAMAFGVPLITNEGINLAKIVSEKDVGWTIEYMNTKQLIEVLARVQTLSLEEASLIRNRALSIYEAMQTERGREVSTFYSMLDKLFLDYSVCGVNQG